MANDCDNDTIIIENSVREAFFTYIDSSARSLVFKQIFDGWSAKLPQIKQVISETKLDALKVKILETFLAWVKLSLPPEVFVNLVSDNPNLMELIFSELHSDESDNLEAATAIVIELIHLSRRRSQYNTI